MYWIVETKEGKPIPMVAPCSEDEAAELCDTMDEHWPQYGPHRVVCLVDATKSAAVLDAAARYVRKLEPVNLDRYENPLERLILAVRAMEDDDD